MKTMGLIHCPYMPYKTQSELSELPMYYEICPIPAMTILKIEIKK
jgi:hypothetical protein